MAAKFHNSIDDFFKGLNEEQSKSVDQAFKYHDEWNKKENQNHLYNNIFVPALQDMYNTVVKNVAKLGKDDASIYKKHKELKGATIEALKAFFKKARPSVLEAAKDIKDEEELYERLVNLYDEYTGQNHDEGNRLSALIEQLSKKKDATVGDYKRELHAMQADHARGGVGYLNNKKFMHHFNKYDDKHTIPEYLKAKMKKKGHTIHDNTLFYRKNLGEYLALRDNIIKGKALPEHYSLKDSYGITPPEEK